MEWLALVIWVLIAMLALPIGAGSLSGALGLGAQAGAAVGGLVFCALYIGLDGPGWAGWLTVAMAVLGLVTSIQGAAVLTSDSRPVSADLQWAEELESGLLGAQIPLFVVVFAVSMCLGLDTVTLA